MQIPDPPQVAPLDRLKRLGWLLVCVVGGLVIGFIGSSISGNSAWYIAVTAVLAVGWWFLADPTQCEPTTAVTLHMPFAPSFPIRSEADVRRLEETPLELALTQRSTYELFSSSARTFGNKTALTFLHSANPEDSPTRWSYAELLAGIHQTANLLYRLGVQPGDAIGVLLPGCLDYHLALWGGGAAGIVQPLNPLLSEEKLIALLNAGTAKVLFAWGSDDEAGIWSKTLRIRTRVPTLRAVLRVAPFDDAKAPTRP